MNTRQYGVGLLCAIDAAGIAVVFVLTAVAYFGAVHPHAVAAAERMVLRAELATRDSGARKLTASESTMERRLKTLRQTLTDDALPLDQPKLINRRLARLGDLADACGVSIDEIRVGDLEAHSHYQTVLLELKGRAEFGAAVLFTHRLHETSPDIGVWSFDLSGNPRNPEVATTCAFNLAWYAAPADIS